MAEAAGQVQDVVLLHGWGMHGSIWNDLRRQLAARLRVHAPDLPGYGARPPAAPATLRGLAAALARTAPERCHAIGWSLGGQIALEWAGARPDQLERLVLIATTPSFVRRAGWPHGIERGVLADFARGLERDPGATLQRFLLLQARGDQRAKAVVRTLREALAARPLPEPSTLAAGLRVLREADLRGLLGSVRQRTLVVQGSRDQLVPPPAADALACALPHARLALIEGAAHAPFLSQPRALHDIVQDFLDER